MRPQTTLDWVAFWFLVVGALACPPWYKLELAVETTVAPLSFLPEGNWLRNLEVEGALDYLATGVPQAGDEVPKGEERFLDDGARWGLSVVAIAPLAPLSP